jgi:hypothetical protein
MNSDAKYKSFLKEMCPMEPTYFPVETVQWFFG